MDNFTLNTVMQRIYHTESVRGPLKISTLAYSAENKQAVSSILDALMQLGQSSAGTLKSLYDSLPAQNELIGYYETLWYPSENWGIKTTGYENQGSDELRLWFQIYSGNEPAAMPKPVLLPDVKILSLTLPSNARVSYGFVVTAYNTTFRLISNESANVTVDWRAYSSVTGNYDSGTITVPKNSFIDFTKGYYYTTAGPATVTYAIYFNGALLDTKSGTVNVAP